MPCNWASWRPLECPHSTPPSPLARIGAVAERAEFSDAQLAKTAGAIVGLSCQLDHLLISPGRHRFDVFLMIWKLLAQLSKDSDMRLTIWHSVYPF